MIYICLDHNNNQKNTTIILEHFCVVCFFLPQFATYTEAIWLRADLKRQICDWMTACLHTLAFWQYTVQTSALTIN